MNNYNRSFNRLYRNGIMILLVCLLLSLWTLPAAAGDAPAANVQVTIGDVSANPGSTVIIPISISQPSTGIGAYNLQLDYDAQRMEVVEIVSKHGEQDQATCSDAKTGCFLSGFDNTAGWVRAIWADASGGAYPIAAAGELFEVKAKIKSDSTTGPINLTIRTDSADRLSFTSPDMEPLQAVVKPGKLEISYPSSGRTDPGITILVDGKVQEQSATLVKSQKDGHSVSTVTLDPDKVLAQINAGTLHTILIPVSNGSDDVVAALNGSLVQAMAQKDAVLVIKTDKASYTLPASQLRIQEISAQIGERIALQDIAITVRIAAASDANIAKAEQAAKDGNVSQVVKPITFEVQASYGDKVIDVNRFNSYVERSIALPDGIDPSRITTAVVLNADGTFTHVPTNIVQLDGKYYANIRSLTNSVYSVIWHPMTFADEQSHWSRSDVNDLASRLVVKGVSDTSFAPNRGVTRAEFVAILSRALGLHEEKQAGTPSYKDIAAQDWFASSVTIAVSYGLANGYADGTFRPNASITRAEAMAMIARAIKLSELQVDSGGKSADSILADFSDAAAIGDWAKESTAAVVAAGLVQGAQGKLNPQAGITRAETAAIVHRLLVQAGFINA